MWVETVEKPKWLETLTSHSPPLFQSTNKLQRIFQSCVEVKREGDWGKEKLTFNLSFSCYVHLHSHDVQPLLWFHQRLVWSLQSCMTKSVDYGSKGTCGDRNKKSLIMSCPLGKPYFQSVRFVAQYLYIAPGEVGYLVLCFVTQWRASVRIQLKSTFSHLRSSDADEVCYNTKVQQMRETIMITWWDWTIEWVQLSNCKSHDFNYSLQCFNNSVFLATVGSNCCH